VTSMNKSEISDVKKTSREYRKKLREILERSLFYENEGNKLDKNSTLSSCGAGVGTITAKISKEVKRFLLNEKLNDESLSLLEERLD
jgi:hypothetical protein